jgi:hypothetical protein
MKKKEPKIVRRIGVHPADPQLTYQLCDDGNVWLFNIRIGSNCGTLDDFLQAVKRNRYRITLDKEE